MLYEKRRQCMLKLKWPFSIGLIFISYTALSAQSPFITTWKTDNPGISNNTSITIPTHSSHTYLYDVDWENDGTFDDLGVTGNITHNYGVAGKYTVAIRGNFPRIWFDNGGDKNKILEINQWGDQQWENLNSAFDGCTNLIEVASDAPDLSIVASLSEMFRRATNFNGDLDNWDVSTVPWMVSMFQDAPAFNGDISSWDVGSCNSIRYMFNNASSFNQDISGWDVSLMSTLQYTFAGASAFDQNLGAWDISNVTDMSHMFDNSGMSRANYDKTLNGWAANSASLQSNVTLGAATMKYCNSFHSRTLLINANSWTILDDIESCSGATFITTWQTDNPGTSNSTSIKIPTNGFYNYLYDIDWENDGSFDQIGITGTISHDYGTTGTYTVAIRGQFPAIRFWNIADKEKILEINAWGEISWQTMDNAFIECSNLHVTAMDDPDLSHVTDMSYMFYGCTVFNESINHWDVSNIHNMSYLFSEASNFNQPLNSWNVAKVSDVRYMFYRASAFNQPLDAWITDSLNFIDGIFNDASSFNQNINSWNVSGVTTLESVFNGATSFNQPLNQWDVSNVTAMEAMFQDASTFNQELGDWNVSLVTDMNLMFSGASSFNQPLDDWNFGATRIGSMFFQATSFNQNINTWDVSGVSSLGRVFNLATSFNQPLDQWDVSNVTQMPEMFAGATSFNQPLGDWVLSLVTDMEGMFFGASSFNQPLNTWDVSQVSEMVNMFRNASSFDQPLNSWDISLIEYMYHMLDSCNMSRSNYDATLNAWATLPLPEDIEFGAAGLTYCDGEAARNVLLSLNWIITGDMLDCSGLCTPLTNTWIGPSSGAWNTPGAWSLGTIPDGCSNVVIPNGKSVLIPAAYQATCHLIEVEQGAALETAAGALLEVQGSSQ